jgi:hypothetical protein
MLCLLRYYRSLPKEKEVILFMASSQVQKVLCPVCHQADEVKKASAAYENGVTRLQPPTMPLAHIGMMSYIIIAFGLVAMGAFFILVWSGTSLGGWPLAVQVTVVALTILAIVTALVISFFAFLRVVQGDMKTQKLLPAYDEAMEKWRRLYYCKRDDVVFDPQTNKTISEAELRSMLSVEANVAHQEVSPQAAVSHQK